MTNEEAIKMLQTEKACVERQERKQNCNRYCESCDLCMPIEDVIEGYNYAIRALKNEQMPNAEKTAEWISVSERLPKEDEFVLVTFGWLRNKEDLAVNIDRISDGEWELSEFVTAWMPLPKPYKAE